MSDSKPLPTKINELLSELEGQALLVEGSFVTLQNRATANCAIVVESIHNLGDDVIKVRESINAFPVVAQSASQNASG